MNKRILLHPFKTYAEWKAKRLDDYFEKRYQGKLLFKDRVLPLIRHAMERKGIEKDIYWQKECNRLVNLEKQDGWLKLQVKNAEIELRDRKIELMEQGRDDLVKLRQDTIALRKELMGLLNSITTESELFNLSVGRFQIHAVKIMDYISKLDKKMTDRVPLEQKTLGNESLLQEENFSDLEAYLKEDVGKKVEKFFCGETVEEGMLQGEGYEKVSNWDGDDLSLFEKLEAIKKNETEKKKS